MDIKSENKIILNDERISLIRCVFTKFDIVKLNLHFDKLRMNFREQNLPARVASSYAGGRRLEKDLQFSEFVYLLAIWEFFANTSTRK